MTVLCISHLPTVRAHQLTGVQQRTNQETLWREMTDGGVRVPSTQSTRKRVTTGPHNMYTNTQYITGTAVRTALGLGWDSTCLGVSVHDD